MNGREAERDRSKMLYRRVTCSDLIGPKVAPSVSNVTRIAATGSNEISTAPNNSNSNNQLPTTPTITTTPTPAERSVSTATAEVPDRENDQLTELVVTEPTAGKKVGKDRFRKLVRMTSAVQLFRKVTATVQRHAVQLSYDYAPPPGVLYADSYSHWAGLPPARPLDVGPDIDRRRTSLSTGALNVPIIGKTLSSDLASASASTGRPKVLQESDEDVDSAGVASKSRSSRPLKSPVRKQENESGHRSPNTSSDLLSHPHAGHRNKQEANNTSTSTSPLRRQLMATNSGGLSDDCKSTEAEADATESLFAGECESHEDEAIGDDEFDVTLLGDALQSHLKALMSKRSSDSFEKPDCAAAL